MRKQFEKVFGKLTKLEFIIIIVFIFLFVLGLCVWGLGLYFDYSADGKLFNYFYKNDLKTFFVFFKHFELF